MSRLPATYRNAQKQALTLAQMQQMYAYPRPMVDPLTQQFVQQNELAKQEGEERYLDTLGGRQGVRDRVTDYWKDYGDSLVADTNRNADLSLKGQLGDLASRGLSGSTLRSSVTNASNRERNAELRRVKDDITRRVADADERTSESIYGMMERRNDVQPNVNQLAQLSQGLGQAGYSPYGAYGGAMPGGGGIGGGMSVATPGGGYRGNQTYDPRMITTGQRTGGQLSPYGGAMGNMGPGSYGSQPNPYQPSPVVNGYDNPMANAQARYAQRQQVDPYAGYNQMMYPQFGAGMMGFQPKISSSGLNVSPYRVTAQVPAAPMPTYDRSRQNAAYEQQQAKNQAMWNGAMTNEWGGYGKNPPPRTVSPGQLAPSQASYEYGNPIEQLGGIYSGAMGALPRYTTFNSAYRNYMQSPNRKS